jgi:hypothetical protein
VVLEARTLRSLEEVPQVGLVPVLAIVHSGGVKIKVTREN